MYLATETERPMHAPFVVGAPRQSDVMRMALCSAYHPMVDPSSEMERLLRALDHVDDVQAIRTVDRD